MVGATAPAAVLFDLDDTLYPQAQFLDGAWADVAEAGARLGLDPRRLRCALGAVASEGSDKGRIIDRAVALVDGPTEAVPPLVAAFGAHRPSRLDPYPGVGDALARLHARVPLGVITDGRPEQQRAKLEATGLAPFFTVVVVTDDHGREHRKPHRHGFDLALLGLGVDARSALMVGDRVEKDVAGARGVGMDVIRVRQGEHAATPTPAGVWEVDDTPAAVEIVLGRLGPPRTGSGDGDELLEERRERVVGLGAR